MAAKEDCFAYIKQGKCAALKAMQCMRGECPFYKTQLEQEEKEGKERWK